MPAADPLFQQKGFDDMRGWGRRSAGDNRSGQRPDGPSRASVYLRFGRRAALLIVVLLTAVGLAQAAGLRTSGEARRTASLRTLAAGHPRTDRGRVSRATLCSTVLRHRASAKVQRPIVAHCERVLGKKHGKSTARASRAKRMLAPAPGAHRSKHSAKAAVAVAHCKPTATTTGCIAPAEAALLPAVTPAGTAQIKGKVTSAATSKPLEGIEVCASGEYGYECAITGAGGLYDITGLAAGEYRVDFFAPYESGLSYLYQYYNDASSYETATPIVLAPGGSASEINAALKAGGQITGKVTSGATSKAVEGIEVCADVLAGEYTERCTQTSATGEYDLVGLETTEYKVEFLLPFNSGLNYLPQFYSNKASYAEAEAVPVTAGSTTSKIDAALHEGGRIAGVVTSAATKADVSGIEVCAYYVEPTGCGLTNASGEYTIGGLTTSTAYRVEFVPNYQPESNINYLTQYYNAKTTPEEAEDVSVTIGSTTQKIDSALQAGGQITGKVTNASKTALAEIEVCADPYSGEPVGEYVYRCTATNTNGEYSVNALPSGDYTVAFSSPNGTYAPQYYNNKVAYFEATAVPVSTGSPTPNINAVMQLGAEIKGIVKDATTEKPVSGIEVCAVLADVDASSSCTTSGTAGEYALADLGEGEYRIEFAPRYYYNNNDLNYLREYYDNKVAAAEANLVTLTPGSVASEINADLHPGGEISGTVTGAVSNADLDDVEVCADENGGEYFDQCASTNKSGEYTIVALPTGQYSVEFYSPSEEYAAKYYKNALSSEEATPVSVTAGETTKEISAALALAGKIEGVVKNAATKAPADGVEVCPIRTSGGATDYCINTNEKGEYTLGGLQAGEYKVEFAPYYSGELWATQYYNDKTTYAEGNVISVAAAQTVGGINAELREAGQITGEVTDATTSKGIEGIEVCVTGYSALDEYIYRCGDSGAGGAYKVVGLPTGEYEVSFFGNGRNYLTQDYNGKANISEATKVAVTTGEVTPHINAALQPGAEITGLVTTKGTKADIGGIEVCAQPRLGGSTGCAITNANGEYSVVALATGEYNVLFSGDGRLNYVAQYYSGKRLYSEATPVSATEGSTTSNISAVMEIGGEISGKVTAAKSKNPLGNVYVEVLESDGNFVTSTDTNSVGEYLVIGIPTGKFVVEFSSGYEEYRTQYYNNKETLAEATPVSVTSEGHVTTEIGAALLEHPPVIETYPTISGTTQEGHTLAELHGTWKNAPTEYTYQWLRCNEQGFECGDVAKATQQTYKTVLEDVGHTLRVEETAHNEGGASEPATSEQTSAIVIAPPENTKAPKITGTAQQGKTLTDEKGTWSNSPSTFKYTWLRCNESGAECTSIAGANASTYVPVQQDVKHMLRVEETAENAAGPGVPAISAPTSSIVPPVPVNTALPKISGTGQQGKTLSEEHGKWEYEPTEYKYQWLQCDSLGMSCVPVSGAKEQTYVPSSTMVGSTLRVEERAVNEGGTSEPATSAATAEVLPALPVNVNPPTITGTAQQGKELAEQHGTWENEVSGYKYEWLRCNGEGAECGTISGAKAQTYTPEPTDVGHTLRVVETAENKGGAGKPATSSQTAVVVPRAPVIKTLPTINGTVTQGKTLTEQHGTWEYAPNRYTYQWLRCNTKDKSCEKISGAEGGTYVLVTADVGDTIRVEETAYNEGGTSLPATSEPTAVVASAVPEIEKAPYISGTAQQGQELTLHHGAWTNEPTGYEDHWLRCNEAGAECSAIGSGATGEIYVPGHADVGHTLRVEEIAHNGGGKSAPATSAQTAVVLPLPPSNITAPTITGEAIQGKTLTVHDGTWEGAPTEYKQQWLECNSLGEGCLSISGATGETYSPTTLLVGHTFRVEEIASNSGGPSQPAISAQTAVVKSAVPAINTPPSVGGLPQKGETLADQPGQWSNEPTSFSYKWLRCNSSGEECAGISGATGPAYLATSADIGHTLEIQEVARNAAGESAPAHSTPSAVVAPVPLHAVAGEEVSTTAGDSVSFDGSGSTPASEITRYTWTFGDGAEAEDENVSHTYTAEGTYTATLTVHRGTESSSASTTVHVAPAPTHTAIVEVTEVDHSPLPGATVLYIGSGGVRIQAQTEANGKASLAGLPEGPDTVYAWRTGFQPAVGHVTVSGGAGETSIALSSGEVATSTLKDHEMTLSEIEAAGINPNEPGNENVYEFEVRLAFIESPGEPLTFHCYINEKGEFTGTNCTGGGGCGGCGGGGGWGGFGGGGGGGGGGPSCSPRACVGHGIVAVPGIVEGHPLIQWLILRGAVTVEKQFFEVTQVVQNLSEEPFKLAQGSTTLNVPPGMSLAPTATPQSATQTVPAIAGKSSATTHWIVRGDEPGYYYLSANYKSKLEPFEAPIELEAQLATPMHVWGVEALSLSVKADEGFLAEGRPYHVIVTVTNNATIPLYNVRMEIFANVHANFVFQPDQRYFSTIAELKPGESVSAPEDILVPDAASEAAFNPELSSVHFVGEEIHPGVGIESMKAPPLYEISAPTETPGMVHLHWQPSPGAEGFEVFSTPNLVTAFAETPNEVFTSPDSKTGVTKLPASATDAYLPGRSNQQEFYALSTIIEGHLVLNHTVIRAAPGATKESESGTFEVKDGSRTFTSTLPPSSVATYEWSPTGSSINWWETSRGKKALVDKVTLQPALSFGPSNPALPSLVVGTQEDQTMEGFGGALTDSSAYLLAHSREEDVVLEDLFSASSGAGFNMIRLPLGASDLVASPNENKRGCTIESLKPSCYAPNKGCDSATPIKTPEECFETYDDVPGSKAHPLEDFSIEHDNKNTIPVLAEAHRFEPGLEILATPWSAPGWMKESGSLVGACGGKNKLKHGMAADYAEYLADAATAYEADGMAFSLLAIQNEPQNCNSKYPTMEMTATEEAVISTKLSADLKRKNHGEAAAPHLIGWEHNWNEDKGGCTTTPTNFPTEVLSHPNDILNFGFHSYCGLPYPTTLTTKRGKPIGLYVTESTGTYHKKEINHHLDGNTGANLDYEVQHELIDPIRDGAKASLYWALVLDQKCGPQFGGGLKCVENGPAGCENCRPMITLNVEPTAENPITINEDYYYWEQFSKFVPRGATYLGSQPSGPYDTAAFKDKDGNIVLVVLNTETGLTPKPAMRTRATTRGRRRHHA